jgi:alpha-D-ribose 1-methylphosphonate 5-triphosphate synthase subunit PhnI
LRRISGTFKDLPGGQILGPTFDYTHRLLDRSLLEVKEIEGDISFLPNADGDDNASVNDGNSASDGASANENDSDSDGDGAVKVDANDIAASTSNSYNAETVLSNTIITQKQANIKDDPKFPETMTHRDTVPAADQFLVQLGLMEKEVEGSADDPPPFDLSRQPLDFPLDRAGRLQALARADEGFLLAMAYSSQRGFGSVHPFVADLRLGSVEVILNIPESNLMVTIGQIEVTECQTANQFKGGNGLPPMFTRGYGLALGHNERKALSMAIVERALRAKELGEAIKGPAQDEEFVLYHSDNVEASGFVSHIKLPHYVDFQAEMNMLRQMRSKLSGMETLQAENE